MLLEKQDPGLIPLERELQERVAWFIRLRWMAGAGIFLGAWAATTLVVPDLSPLPFYLVGVGVLCYNALFAALLRRFEPERISERAYGTLIGSQVAVDWVCLAVIVTTRGESRARFPLRSRFT